mgnify:CR=1 FL=1
MVLQHKHVLITGGFSGIGRALADLLLQSKARVTAVGRTAAAAPPASDGYFPLVCDIASEADGRAVAQQASEHFGPVDILVHCAGEGILKAAPQLTADDFERSMRDNFYSAVWMTQALLPALMERQEGTLIYVPGVLGKSPMAGAAAYGASKYALVGYVKSLREDLKRTRVRVTTLFFGGVDSPFWDPIDLRVQRDKMISIPDAAKAIWFAAQQPESAVLSELVLQPFNHQVI